MQGQGYRFTPFSELKDGDQYIRIGGRPVLLSDIRGHRDGPYFIPDLFGRDYLIYVLRSGREVLIEDDEKRTDKGR